MLARVWQHRRPIQLVTRKQGLDAQQLAWRVARDMWGWGAPESAAVLGLFLLLDSVFFGANLLKIADGGWLPMALGVMLFTAMLTWKRVAGRWADPAA